MYGHFCIGFIDFILAGKKLTDSTNLFSSHDLKNKEKNDNIILSYFKKCMKVIPLNIIPSKIVC